MLILTLNCGSSSVKAALIQTDGERRIMDLQVTSIGSAGTALEVDGQSRAIELTTHAEAVSLIIDAVRDGAGSLTAVAHRVVHGGSQFTRPAIIDLDAEVALEALNTLAPLHNPIAIAGIRTARRALPLIPHVAVFDTAFHATLPPRAREYALPPALTARLNIRRYGFHGTSHAHVARAVAQHLDIRAESLRIVSCHLGNGASVTAIEYGRSIDTSMGMTPLEGLIMGSRAGDIDAGVLLQLLRLNEYDVDSLDTLLNRESGLKALTGTNDMRTIEARAAAGDAASRDAIDAYAYRVRKYIGAYAAAMGGTDAIAFTAGIGEHSATIRARVCERLEFLGAELDETANRSARVRAHEPTVCISTARARTRVFVVRADEELSLAREATALLATAPSTSSS